jgi:hypothetical protein
MSSKASASKPSKEMLSNPMALMRKPRTSHPASQSPQPTVGNLRLTPSEIRLEARSLRELLLWDLREQGYCLREIAGVLGLTKQRVSQLETGMIRRAVIAKAKAFGATSNPRKIIWKRNTSYVDLITYDDFGKRVDALNARYEAQLKRILRRSHRWQTAGLSEPSRSTLFRKVWPVIERYRDKPFNFSKLVEDFPVLAREPHLRQLLSRLRRQGLLRKVGSVRIESHNLPEVLMARTALEESVSTQIEKLTSVWGRKLRELEVGYRSIRPNQTLRDHIREILRHQGRSGLDFEKALGQQDVETLAEASARKADSAAAEYSI